MPRREIKRETDLQIISGWVQPGQRVLDLGCGRGVLLDHLQRTKQIYGVGIDPSIDKVASCVKKGVNVFQGEAEAYLPQVPAQFYDWVVLSRTVQELSQPGPVILAALRAGKQVAVGFINYGYWKNRWDTLWRGSIRQSEVFPEPWEATRAHIPVTVRNFEAFCARSEIRVVDAAYLRGDWKTPITGNPNWRAGYAVYALSKG